MSATDGRTGVMSKCVGVLNKTTEAGQNQHQRNRILHLEDEVLHGASLSKGVEDL